MISKTLIVITNIQDNCFLIIYVSYTIHLKTLSKWRAGFLKTKIYAITSNDYRCLTLKKSLPTNETA